MENSLNYILISIKLLDIFPSVDEIINDPKIELLIVFQGNNEFYDLRELLSSKKEVIININKLKKTIIISLIKSDMLYATSIFNIKNGEHWTTFNYENKKKKKSLTLSLVDCIKIKLFCRINDLSKNNENNYLIKNNSSNNMHMKKKNNSNENKINKNFNSNMKNKINKHSPLKILNRVNYDTNTNNLKESFSYIYKKDYNNYYSILTENSSKLAYPSLSKNNITQTNLISSSHKKYSEKKIINHLSYFKKNSSNNKNELNLFNNLSAKTNINKISSLEKKKTNNKLNIISNKNNNNINQINQINDDLSLKTIEPIVPNKMIKKINEKKNNIKNINKNDYINNDVVNKSKNNNNDKNYFSKKIFEDSFNLLKGNRGTNIETKSQKKINIKTPINNAKNILKNQFNAKTYKKENNIKIKKYQDKNDYIYKEIENLNYLNNINSNKNITSDSYNIKNIFLNKSKDKEIKITKENQENEENHNDNNTNNNSDISEESYDMNDFYKLKEDFLLLYNDEYNHNIKDDLLKLEIDLFIEKVVELIMAYHMNMNQKMIENEILEHKYKLKISKYLLINKLYSKLQQLKNDQKIKKYIKIKNKNQLNNCINKDEINLFKFIFPSPDDYSINKNKKLIDIIDIILNKNDNKRFLDDNRIKWIENNKLIYNGIDEYNHCINNNNIINLKVNIKNKNSNNKNIYDKNNSCYSIENTSLNDDKTIYKRKIPLLYQLKNK